MTEQTAKRRRFTLPSAYTILFGLIVTMAVATWLVPAGEYDVDGDGSPVPGTYHEVGQRPQRILADSVLAPVNGMYGIQDDAGFISYGNTGTLFGAIDVALFIIVIGGFLGVTMRTGAIQAGIGRLIRRLHGRERWMIPILMAVFALGGTTFGMAEESLAFYALVISVMVAAGYDRLTAAAVLLVGCGIGVFGSTINPFATGIASGFAGIPISQGIGPRLVILLVGLGIGVWFVMRYAARVKADPARSLVHDVPGDGVELSDGDELTGRHKVILVVFALAFLVMMYGVIPWQDMGIGLPTLGWWFPEMTGSFILFAVVVGIVGRLRESTLTESFVAGARDLLGVALIIGIARGITVIMNNGRITDTVLHWAETALGDVGTAAFAIVMFALFLPLSFLIPSSSGLATVAMPIMVPLTGFVGVAPDLAVTAFQSASGLMNLFIPTSAVVMGGLAIARVPYGRYLRWVWPLLLMLTGLTAAVLIAGALAA
jgi:uncharacterized ion transporter superfamily protein YfcC